jgi:O-antigen/teichoic acid export membrane protein
VQQAMRSMQPSNKEITINPPWSVLINLFTLYAGKSAGIIVAFVFLPLYSQLLGSSQFGIVAVIFSLQALLMMADLGVAAILNRDAAANPTKTSSVIRLLKTAERVLAIFYFVLFTMVIAIKIVAELPNVSWAIMLGAMLLICAVVAQNLYYTVTLSTSDFKSATIVQVLGILSRAGITWLVIAHYSQTVSAFIASQALAAIVHALISRRMLLKRLIKRIETSKLPIAITWSDCFTLLKRGKPLMVTGMAGAAVMHLDKPILSAFSSAADVAPYFLATTLSATPVAILAGPIVQLFQPKIVHCIAAGQTQEALRYAKYLLIFIFSAVLLPIATLIFYCNEFVALWLGSTGQIELVSSYSRILLFGYIVAALGYVPLIIITANQNFVFQANLSVFSTLITLAAVALFSASGNITYICVTYAAYFFMITICLMWRAKSFYFDLKRI